MMNITRAVIVAFCLSGASLFAQVDVGIVLPFENQSRNPQLDWISESFAVLLSSNLASPRFMMLDRRERAAAFDSLGIPNTSILSDATIYKVAQAVDANKLILGKYEYSDDVFTVRARVMDMDGPTLSKEFIESGPLAELVQLQAGIAWQILLFLRPSLPIAKADFIADHRIARLDAFENFVRGLIAKNRADQIRYFRNALRLDSQFTKPAFELGMIYFRDHDYPTSMLWLSKLRRGDDEYLEANYFLGLANLYHEQYERAAAAFRVVAQQLPLNEVYNNLGIALLRQNKPGATGYFEQAIQSDASDPDYRFNLGYALWKRDNCGPAIPHLRRAVQSSNSHPSWRAIYIACLEKTGQNDEAARQERILQQQAPDWVRVKDPRRFQYLERPKVKYDGASLRQLRMLIEVQRELKHSKLPPAEHVALHFQQAQTLLDEGFDREAAEELRQAIDYDPDNVQGYLQLASIHTKARRFADAMKTLNQLLQRTQTATGHLMLAKIYLEQGKWEEAQSQISTALHLEPSSAEAAMMMQELNSKYGSHGSR
ncbi:MAG: tetratricopeptide repeat protein [Acidobacteria bacterium]|nr:tetratricopeptide repeat protein [Acidobacteriota bacterium]